MNNSSIMTPLEQQRLENTQAYREKMLNKAFEHGAPEKAQDIEAINAVLNSMDKATYDAINARLKHQENQTQSVLLDTIAEAIKMTQDSQRAQKEINGSRTLELPEELKVTDSVPGELDTQKEDLRIEDFVQGE